MSNPVIFNIHFILTVTTVNYFSVFLSVTEHHIPERCRENMDFLFIVVYFIALKEIIIMTD
jgi:hypothetical protein